MLEHQQSGPALKYAKLEGRKCGLWTSILAVVTAYLLLASFSMCLRLYILNSHSDNSFGVLW